MGEGSDWFGREWRESGRDEIWVGLKENKVIGREEWEWIGQNWCGESEERMEDLMEGYWMSFY